MMEEFSACAAALPTARNTKEARIILAIEAIRRSKRLSYVAAAKLFNLPKLAFDQE